MKTPNDIPYTRKLSWGEQIAVFREIKCNPKTDRERLARYYDTNPKEIRRAYLKGCILKWK